MSVKHFLKVRWIIQCASIIDSTINQNIPTNLRIDCSMTSQILNVIALEPLISIFPKFNTDYFKWNATQLKGFAT